jgi:hypothetical protein
MESNVRQMPLTHNQLTAVATKLAKERAKENYINRLRGKAIPRSYYEKHIGVTRVTHFFSFVLNAFFVCVAVYCASSLTSFSSAEGYIILIAAVLIFGLVEFGKRKSSDHFFDNLFQLKIVNGWLLLAWLCCFLVSAGFGVWGVIRANDTLAGPDPTLVSYQKQIEANNARIAEITTEKNNLETNPSNKVSGGRDAGKIRYNIEKQITELNSSKAKLIDQTTTLSEKIAGKTKYFEPGYEAGIKRQGIVLGVMFFGLEVFLLGFLAWKSYFDFRVLGETDPQKLIEKLKAYLSSKNPDIDRHINDTIRNFQ